MGTFGERLARLRSWHSLSQAELAKRLNIAKSTLAMYETDKREPSFEIIQRIAEHFQVTTDYLIKGDGRSNDVTNRVCERLKSARSFMNVSLEEVAEKLQLTPGTLYDYENGNKIPERADMEKLAGLYGVALPWLYGFSNNSNLIVIESNAVKESSARNSFQTSLSKSNELIAQYIAKTRHEDQNKNADLVMIPVLGTIKAGYDLYADQQVIDRKPISREDILDGEYFYLVVKGDSMEGEGIREGMRVLVRRQDWVDQGKIGVVLVNGDEATLKRVFYTDGNVILHSANPKYPPRTIKSEEAHIQGQVTKVEWDV